LNRLSRAHERYRRQTTDDRQTDRQTEGRAIAYSEREREFTFAKNYRGIESYGIIYHGLVKYRGIPSGGIHRVKRRHISVVAMRSPLCRSTRSYCV